MFGIGMPELLLIMIIGLVFIGPSKLPEVLKALGKGIVEFKRATNDIRRTVEEEMNKVAEQTDLKEFKDDMNTIGKDVNNIKNELNTSVTAQINKPFAKAKTEATTNNSTLEAPEKSQNSGSTSQENNVAKAENLPKHDPTS